MGGSDCSYKLRFVVTCGVPGSAQGHTECRSGRSSGEGSGAAFSVQCSARLCPLQLSASSWAVFLLYTSSQLSAPGRHPLHVFITTKQAAEVCILCILKSSEDLKYKSVQEAEKQLRLVRTKPWFHPQHPRSQRIRSSRSLLPTF